MTFTFCTVLNNRSNSISDKINNNNNMRVSLAGMNKYAERIYRTFSLIKQNIACNNQQSL